MPSIHPTFLRQWGSPPRSNEEFQAFVVPGFKTLRNVHVSMVDGEDMIIDEVSHKVVLYLKSTGEMDIGPYSNEYMVVLKMNEDGTLIKEVIKFIDSAGTRDIITGLQERMATKE